MSVKDVARPVPGVRQLSLLRQRLGFVSSAHYWDRHYRHGGTSGGGSYGALALAKAAFLNEFVQRHRVQSIIEFGCGDGHQLSLANYPSYVGLDVSGAAISLCKRRFADDMTKSFFFYDGVRFVDRAGLFKADLSLSLDVIYHLIEDEIYETYMLHLFSAARQYVVIYATDTEMSGTAPHVRHRHFSSWVRTQFPSWRLAEVTEGPNSGPGRADFFVYQRVSS